MKKGSATNRKETSGKRKVNSSGSSRKQKTVPKSKSIAVFNFLKKWTVTVMVALLVIYAVGLLFMLTLFLADDVKKGTSWQTQTKMQSYLESKYNEKFIVDKPKHSGGGFAVEGVWTAKARPAADKSIVFEVKKSGRSDSFSDQYTAELWSKSESERISNIATQNNTKWKAEATVKIHLAEPLSDKATPDNTKLEEVIKQDHGMSYTLDLKYSNIDKSDKENAIRDTERVVKHLRDIDGVHNLDINYSIVGKDNSTSKCSMIYDKPYDYSYEGISKCLNIGER